MRSIRLALLASLVAGPAAAQSPDVWVLCGNAFGVCDEIGARLVPGGLEIRATDFTLLSVIGPAAVLQPIAATALTPGAPPLGVHAFATSLYPLWRAGDYIDCYFFGQCPRYSGTYVFSLAVAGQLVTPFSIALVYVNPPTFDPYPRREVACDISSANPSCGNITTTPEPSTLGLVTTGLLGLGLVGWRRRLGRASH